jgi:elongation factor 2
MTRQKRIEELLELMRDPDHIRNIGIVAHIDHGKTTLTDSLLANAGMLSYDLVGQARALDYLEEEQRRGNVTAETRRRLNNNQVS